jgi:hypothetical protein
MAIQKHHIPMPGEAYGRWEVVSYGHASGGSNTGTLCRCACGVKKVVRAESLLSGRSKSCGCRRSEVHETHLMTKSPEHMAWGGAKARCNNPKNPHYADYGGRGIRVCAEWETSFEAFFRAMGPRPSPSHSLDRIDNDKGYEPENCRWATKREQSRNQRGNVFINACGATRTLSEWAELTGIHKHTIQGRLRAGWEPTRAVTEPPRLKGR